MIKANPVENDIYVEMQSGQLCRILARTHNKVSYITIEGVVYEPLIMFEDDKFYSYLGQAKNELGCLFEVQDD